MTAVSQTETDSRESQVGVPLEFLVFARKIRLVSQYQGKYLIFKILPSCLTSLSKTNPEMGK